MTHKGKVLIIVENLPVPFDRRVWQEARTLKENGYGVSIICPKGSGYPGAYECLEGIHIYRHPLPLEAGGAAGYVIEYGWSLLCQFWLSAKILLRHGFDAIHACNPPDIIFIVSAFYKILFGKKFLFDHHDINPELYEAKFGRRDLFYRLLLLCERLTFRVADVSIATNESYRAIAITRGGMAPENVFVVRSGPDLARLRRMPPVPAHKHEKPYLVAYLGVMGSQEGLDFLLEAARRTVQEHGRKDAHFTLIGDGPERPALMRLAQSKGLGDCVTFTGRIPDRELLEILNTADLCVNSDSFNAMNDQSTMNKILEYMALGKPIVQFDLTEGRVSAGNASLYAQPDNPADLAEKICLLLDNPAQRETMGMIGRSRIETALSWPHQVPALLAAYEALFRLPPPSRKWRWYYHRLRAMTLPEIGYRIHQKIRRELDRRFPSLSAAADCGALPSLPGLKEALLAAALPETLLESWERLREETMSGTGVFLGQRWPRCSPEEKWHLDPVSGKYWPKEVYCFDADYRHASGYGDVKYVWELNRLQYMQPLAALAMRRNDAALARFCLEEMECWIDANPPYLGVHWASGIELALRLTSIFFTTSLLAEHATPAQRGKLWASIATHAFWLERYPSRYSSANNHRAAEGLGLFLAGALCPRLPHAARWRKNGWRQLCESSHTLILPDGCGAEQAVAYTAFTLEMLMLGLYVAQQYGEPVPAYYTEQLERAGECLSWFTDTDGNLPHIGDDDNACIIGHDGYSGHYPLSVFNALASAAPPSGLKTFHDGGYTVARDNAHGRDVMLVFDHGALGHLSIAAHGHADALSVWLHMDGHPVLADAGNYLYHADRKQRDMFRSTAAHNTLCVEGADSSLMAGAFNWSHKARARLNLSECGRTRWRIEAEHDGYRSRFGLVHRRTLAVRPGQGFVVEDRIEGGRARAVSIRFLIHPALSVILLGSFFEVSREGKPILRVLPPAGWDTALEPAAYAPRFGEMQSAQRLVFRHMLAPGTPAVTEFVYL